MQVSHQLHAIFKEARDIARRSGRVFGSIQLLLAMFTEETDPNQARTVLLEHGVDEDSILDCLQDLPPEPEDTMAVLLEKTQTTAISCGAPLVNSLHLLLAITQMSSSLAYGALVRQGVRIGDLRVQVLSYLTGVMPRRLFRPVAEPETPLPAYDWAAAGAAREAAPPPRDPEREAPPRLPPPRPDVRPLPAVRDHEAARKMLAQLVASTREAPFARTGSRPAGATGAVSAAPVPGRSRFELDPDTFPVLSSLTRNLTVEAEAGTLDPLIGRADELDQVLDTLHKRRANNPCLVGPPGVGKTAIVEGVAQEFVALAARGGEVRTLVELNVGQLIAGTQLRGALSERIAGLRKEVHTAGRRVVVFIDEIHTLIGAGAGSGPLDAANELKAALARGEFPCIGATTHKEYRAHIENDAALERRFHPVTVDEPSAAEAETILHGMLPRYGAHHGVAYDPACVPLAVRLASRYVPDRALPDKALNLLDLAGARAARTGLAVVTPEEVTRVVAKLAGIPLENLLVSDRERLLSMEAHLQAHIIGQPAPVERIAAMIRRNSAGFRSRRPIGSLLLLGPTGVGKTETVRVLADFLFQDRDAVSRFDMSEFSEPHAVAKLIGAGPGYVGHDEGGQLTEAVHRRPYQIVLLDEVEKAHPEVLNILLQILEEGALKDGKGRPVDFRNVLLAMTSNLGAAEFERKRSGIGFSRPGGEASAAATAERDRAERAQSEQAVLDAARRAFAPELWNRIDEKLVYHPLDRAAVGSIAALLLAESSRRLRSETGISYEVAPEVVEFLIEQGGFDARYGARPLRRTLQRHVEGCLSQAILQGTLRPDTVAWVTVKDGALVAVPKDGAPDAPHPA